MPRSKLGLTLTVEKLCQREKFNPMKELIQSLKERDEHGKHVIRGRERIAALGLLINKLKPTPKPQETVVGADRKLEINRLNFELPPLNGTTTGQTDSQ